MAHKKRDYALKSPVREPEPIPVEELPVDESDDIPLHREVGDICQFPYADTMRTGEVIAVKDSLTCLIESDGDTFFEKGVDITFLPDSARCTHCGQFAFLCSNECPAKQRKPRKDKPMNDSKLISLGEVIAMPVGFINDKFQAIVMAEPAVNKKKEVYYKTKLVQSGNPAISIAAKFWGDVDLKALNGKLVEFNGSGIQRTEYKPEKGPAIQQVSISDKKKDGTPLDNFTVIGESAHADKPLPHAPSTTRDVPQKPSESISGANGAHLTDVLRRAKCYFGVFLRIENAYEAARQAGLQSELSVSDLKDIATHISMTYRGDYGCYAEPVFEKKETNGSMAPRQLEEMSSKEWGNEEEPEVPHGSRTSPPVKPSWKDFFYTKRNAKLGDLSQSDLLSFARWAMPLAEEEVPESGLEFYKAVKEMALANKWDHPNKCFVASVLDHQGYGKDFLDADIEGYVSSETGSSLDELNDDMALTLMEDFAATVEAIKDFAAKSRKPAKKKHSTALPE